MATGVDVHSPLGDFHERGEREEKKSPLVENNNGKSHLDVVGDKDKRRTRSFSLNYFEEDPTPAVTSEESPKQAIPQLLPKKEIHKEEEKEIQQIDKPATPPPVTTEPSQTEEQPINKEEPIPSLSTPALSSVSSPSLIQSVDNNERNNNNNNNTKVGEDLKFLFTLDSFPILKERALDGNLNHTGLRGIIWRVLLGVLSADTSLWADQIQKHREKFVKLREKHIIDPHKASVEAELDKFNPLSQHEENPWNQYFQDADLQKEITHDVLRTYQGNPFFDLPSTKETLTQLLFLYAKEHSKTRYIQGMNELLAPILFVLYNERIKCCESPSIFDIVSNEDYLLHDTYTLFSHLLKIVGRWFSPLKTGHSPLQSKKDALLDDKLYFGSGQADESTNLQIVQQCRHIHYTLLNEVDPHLSRYLRDLQIEPHLYMLRWVRIVLTQVFQLNDVLVIWDGIFAYGNNAVLLDWLCVAMLVTIRHSLLGQDYSTCMQLLFNYPQDQDIRALVATALKLHGKYQQQRQIALPPKSASASSIPALSSSPNSSSSNSNPASNSLSPPSTFSPNPKAPVTNTITHRPAAKRANSPSNVSNTTANSNSAKPTLANSNASNSNSNSGMKERAPTPPNVPQFPQANQDLVPSRPTSASSGQKQKSLFQYIFSEGPDAAAWQAINEEAHHLRNVSAHMANRLDRVLYLLNSLPSTPENEETLTLAIEEVAQVKATLGEVSEFRLKNSIETFEQRESQNSLNNSTNIIHNNNNNSSPTTPSSPPDPNQPQNVYEKILAMKVDPLNIFRRK